MPNKTTIEWTATYHEDGTITPGYTSNPIKAKNLETGKVGHFCVHASPGCEHCYAETMQQRFGTQLKFIAQNRKKVEFFWDSKESEALVKLNEQLGEERADGKMLYWRHDGFVSRGYFRRLADSSLPHHGALSQYHIPVINQTP